MSYWETFEEHNPAAPQYALEFARIWKDLPKIVYSSMWSGGSEFSPKPLDEVGDEGPRDPAPSADLVSVDDAGIGEGPGLTSVYQLAAAGREQVA